MSPEQARGTELDARSDIWSLGVVLYELITGQKPFTGPTPSHVIVSLLEKEPPSLSNYVVDVPEALELIVEETLRKDREERTQTAKELLGRLRRLKQRIDAGVSLDRLVDITASPDPSQPNLTAQRSLSGMTGERGELGTRSGERLVTQSGPVTSLVKRQRWALLLILLAVPLVAGLYAIYKVANRGTSTSTPAAMKITRLTTSGRAFAPVISPDGKYVAHVISTGNKQSLVLRQTATSVSRELVAGTDSYFLGATFTPDGNYLCYLRADRGQNVRTLYQISLLGGDPRQLVYDVDAPISFSPDGNTSMERENLDLWITNANGSNAVQLTFEPGADLQPSVCADGRYVVFLSNRGMRWGIWRLKIDGGDPVELVRNTPEYSNPVCSRDSQWIIYGSEVNNK